MWFLRYGRRRSRLATRLTAVLLVMCFASSVSPQSVCAIKTVEVGSLNGRVIDAGASATPWANVAVHLRSTDEQVIAAATTDPSGYFSLAPLKRNTYFLDFKTDLVPTYRAVVKLRNSGSSTKKPWVLIRLGADCGVSDADKLK